MFASKNDRSNRTARLEFDRPIPFFQQTRSLPLTFLYFQRLSLLMCDVYHQAVPSNLRGKFRLMTDVHSYRTRSASNQQYFYYYYVEYSRTGKMEKSFARTGALIWNGLPKSLKSLRKS